jgi:patatin-related protein
MAPYSREVRVGLVLYGGVSLAVYENGVAQEFYRAVRGEGIYSLLKDAIDSDIVVDVISGTSAGGVNGILLGYALANGLDFTSVARLWLEDGDIERLMRARHDPETKSLLDSEGYYQARLEGAFQNMQKTHAGPDSRESTVSEMDVFITGTNVAGSVRTVFDDVGHSIDVKDHRAMFKLQFRGPRKNDFAPSGLRELATLARITSCFPVAFAPVEVQPQDYPNLARWGRLSGDAVYLDGGILDNKPFSYAIDAIFGRKADRDVSRLLFYVEPNPERFRQAAEIVAPGPVSAAFSALMTIPGYESISSDLDAISRHNETVSRIEGLVAQVAVPAYSGAATLDVSTLPLSPREAAVYITSRLTQIRNRAVEGILNEGHRRPFFDKPEDRRAARILVESFSAWQGSALDALEQFDVYFRVRRLYHLTYTLKAYLCDGDPRPGPVEERTRALWRDVNHYIQLLEVLQSQMEFLVDHLKVEWRALHQRFMKDGSEIEPSAADLAAVSDELWGQMAAALEGLLHVDALSDLTLRDPFQETAFYTTMVSRCHAMVGGAERGSSENILRRIDAEIVAQLTAFEAEVADSPVPAAFAGFAELDRQVFPLQFAANTPTRDIIQIVRLSPVDAQRGLSARAIDDKICGRALGAFGGFFKKPWRANDVMWGRLDALCQLVECTFTRARVAKLRHAAVGSEADLKIRLAALFPATDDRRIAALAVQLSKASSLSDAEFEGLVTALVEAGQWEIVNSEWRQVIDAAIAQEKAWGHHRVIEPDKTSEAPYAPERLAWRTARQSPDGLVLALAAQAAAQPQTALFSRYRLAGRPFFEEIPQPVLLELATLAVLRIEKSVMNELPEPLRQRLRVPVLHTVLFNWVVPALYGWAKYARTAPEYGRVLSASLLAISLVVLLLALTLLTVGLGNLGLSAMVLGSLVAIAAWVRFFKTR